VIPGIVCELEVRVEPGAGEREVVVTVVGEIDIATAPGLRDRLRSLVDAGLRDFVVDLVGVSFMDSTGIATFLGLHRRLCEAGGGKVTLRGPRASVAKVLELTGLRRVLLVVEA
jgi:anti-anti-sigma factor